MIEVEQKTELGKLGLSALVDKGFCGPNYDLSSFLVQFYRIDKNINVSFYDMNCSINKENKLYERMDSLMKEYEEKELDNYIL